MLFLILHKDVIISTASNPVNAGAGVVFPLTGAPWTAMLGSTGSKPMLQVGRFELGLVLGLAATGVLASESVESAADRQARAAVAHAQGAVIRARNAQALWTVAEEALERAQRALVNGNYTVAIEQAQLASEFAELGIAQKSFPLVR